MFFTGKHLNAIEPGCDFFRNRSFGLFFFRHVCVSVLMLLASARAAVGVQLARASAASVHVGSIVSEEIRIENASNDASAPMPTVSPAGSAVFHLSQAEENKKDRAILRIRFLKPGRCMVRLPANWIGLDEGADRAKVRIFEVRPWPVSGMVARNAVRAGVGPLVGGLESANGESGVVTGEPVLIRLKLTGTAAMAVEESPDLSIVHAESEGRASSSPIRRPLIVEENVDWGGSNDPTMSRCWIYEWRGSEPGKYRIMPLRFMHLDDSGQVQTRLVTGLTFEVRSRELFRAVAGSGEAAKPNRGGAAGNPMERVVALGLGIGVLAMFATLFARILGRGHWLAWSLRRKLRAATSPEHALAAWRSIEPAWKAGRGRLDPESVGVYEQLRRRAFGPPPSGSSVSQAD